jgi:hypothetical protein
MNIGIKKILLGILFLSVLLFQGCSPDCQEKECTVNNEIVERLPSSDNLKVYEIEEGYGLEINLQNCRQVYCEKRSWDHWCFECPGVSEE